MIFISQFSSVTQSCPTLCDPMNCSTPGFPVHHQLPEFTQTHVHRVGDAIQPSHLLSSPSPPVPIPPSIRVFSNESTLPIRWPKYWSIYILIISWTCTDKGSINIKVLGDSADKRSPARLFAEGQQKRGHSSHNSNLFSNLAQSGFNRTGRELSRACG